MWIHRWNYLLKKLSQNSADINFCDEKTIIILVSVILFSNNRDLLSLQYTPKW